MSGDERDLVNLFSLGNKRNKYFCNLRMFLCNTSAYIINSFCCCGDERECVISLRHLFEWFRFQNKQNKYFTLIFLISWLRGQRKFSDSIFLIIVVGACTFVLVCERFRHAGAVGRFSAQMSETRRSFIHSICVESSIVCTQVIIIDAYIYTA